MTLPRSLHLVRDAPAAADAPPTYVLASRPVAELAGLRTSTRHLRGTRTLRGWRPFAGGGRGSGEGDDGVDPARFELRLAVRVPADGSAGLELNNSQGEVYRVGYDRGRGVLFSDRSASRDAGATFCCSRRRGAACGCWGREAVVPYAAANRLELNVFVDEASVEVFVDGGRRVLTETVFPTARFERASLFAFGHGGYLHEAVVHGLEAPACTGGRITREPGTPPTATRPP